MPSMAPSLAFTIGGILLLAYLSAPVAAFGAGNIGEFIAISMTRSN